MALCPRRACCALEFAVFFVGLPLLAAWQGPLLKRWVIPQLLLLGALVLTVLWRDPSFDRGQLQSVPAIWRTCLRRIAVVLVLGGAGALVLAIAWPQIRVFALPREHPILWLALLVLYPSLSAVAQELIFRVFVFHRYKSLFPNDRAMILASAAAFALAHLELGNLVAPTLSLIGGLRFGYTYRVTGSLAMASLEHGLWGDWLLTIGLGAYFYGGNF